MSMWSSLNELTEAATSAMNELDQDITTQLQEELKEEEERTQATPSVRRRTPPRLRTAPGEAATPPEGKGGASKKEKLRASATAAGEGELKVVTEGEDTVVVEPAEKSSSEDGSGGWDSIVHEDLPAEKPAGEQDGSKLEAAQAEIGALKYALAEKEEEVASNQEALSNLQRVLEDFQLSREMERNHLAGELQKAQARAAEYEELRGEVSLWRNRYTESEEASAELQQELEGGRTELLRLQVIEEHLVKERAESRRLAFELKELETTHKKQGSTASEVPASVSMEIREQGRSGPAAREGLWKYFGILLEPGPYGVPYGLTLYFFLMHFVAWWGHRRCF